MMDQAVSQVLSNVERAVDDELERQEDELANIRRRRVEEMKRKAEEKMEWQRNGHGRMAIVGDQKEFFSYTKSSARVVCLFTREHGKILTEHLSMLAQRHLEARFICVDAEKAPFITEKLNIWMLPTIVCLKDNK
ncbi:hypothetical protein EMIHUDRAFT_46671, partial [Emiliania huxleyi CCMP1516]|uniref:Thioredoxin domain-containing protein n=2 Tax=Emiliania huxleyi TaxID=2903 RepID=A0A0D3JW00_EMIH1